MVPSSQYPSSLPAGVSHAPHPAEEASAAVVEVEIRTTTDQLEVRPESTDPRQWEEVVLDGTGPRPGTVLDHLLAASVDVAGEAGAEDTTADVAHRCQVTSMAASVGP